MSIQALIPPALAALHNFIRQYDPDEIQMYDNGDDGDDNHEPIQLLFQMAPHPESLGELGNGPLTQEETVQANERRDRIAGAMWEQYQRYLESRAARHE